MPSSVDEVRSLRALVGFGETMRAQSQELKHFLLHSLYRHEQVAHTMGHARQIVHELLAPIWPVRRK